MDLYGMEKKNRIMKDSEKNLSKSPEIQLLFIKLSKCAVSLFISLTWVHVEMYRYQIDPLQNISKNI